MPLYRIIVLVLLLSAGFCARAQTDIPDSLNRPKGDSTIFGRHVLRDTATIAPDSTITFVADSIKKPDSTSSVLKVKKHSPLRAVWMSAVLPGLGQAYNKKYWKIPIIYAGLGGLGYLLYFESSQFTQARNSYRIAVRSTSNSAVYQGVELDAATIKAYRDYYLKIVNYAAVGMVLWYALNLIDAAVDGHLYHYNMDDKLGFNVDPSFHISSGFGPDPTCLGLSLTVVPLGGKHRRGM